MNAKCQTKRILATAHFIATHEPIRDPCGFFGCTFQHDWQPLFQSKSLGGADIMKQTFLCAVLAILPALVVAQAQTGQVKTFGLFNGYAWNAFGSAEVQRIYLAGASEALIREAPAIFEKSYTTGNLTTADVQVLVTNFYSETANLPIPIIDALHVVSMKTRGVSQEDINAAIQFDRERAKTAPERNGNR